MRRRHLVAAAAAVAAVVALPLAGCTAPASTTSGPRTLRVAYYDPNSDLDPAVDWFTNALTDVSDERFGVDLRWGCCEPATTTAEAEAAIIDEVGTGHYDVGIVGVRALDVAGVSTLDGLLAPLQITSYAEQKAVLTDPAVLRAARSIDRVGDSPASVVALLPGPERYPVSFAAPLLTLADWSGRPIYTVANEVQADTLEALGAEPVAEGARDALIAAGAITGTENSVLWAADFAADVKAVTANVALWPKPSVVLLSPQLARELSDEERGWIEQAAQRALATTELIQGFDERFTQVCTFPDELAPAEEIARLVTAVRPVHDRLAASASTRAVLARVDELAGPPGAAEPPQSC